MKISGKINRDKKYIQLRSITPPLPRGNGRYLLVAPVLSGCDTAWSAQVLCEMLLALGGKRSLPKICEMLAGGPGDCPTNWETCSLPASAQPPFLPRTKENALCKRTFHHHGPRKNMPSQGILHVLPLNVSPENAQRLGVVPAFWELGVVALHGTEAPRAWGGRMLETT